MHATHKRNRFTFQVRKSLPYDCAGGTQKSPNAEGENISRYTLKSTKATPGSHFQKMFQDFKSEVYWNLDLFVTLEATVFSPNMLRWEN